VRSQSSIQIVDELLQIADYPFRHTSSRLLVDKFRRPTSTSLTIVRRLFVSSHGKLGIRET
jgi:hypothetical protein